MPRRKHFYPRETQNHLQMLEDCCEQFRYSATVYPDGTWLCRDWKPGEDPDVCSHHEWIAGPPWYAVKWFLFG